MSYKCLKEANNFEFYRKSSDRCKQPELTDEIKNNPKMFEAFVTEMRRWFLEESKKPVYSIEDKWRMFQDDLAKEAGISHWSDATKEYVFKVSYNDWFSRNTNPSEDELWNGIVQTYLYKVEEFIEFLNLVKAGTKNEEEELKKAEETWKEWKRDRVIRVKRSSAMNDSNGFEQMFFDSL